MELSLPLKYEQLLYLISLLPDNQRQRLKFDIDKLSKQKTTTNIENEEFYVNEDVQKLLKERKDFSQNNPESRLTWLGVREEIAQKYGF